MYLQMDHLTTAFTNVYLHFLTLPSNYDTTTFMPSKIVGEAPIVTKS